MVKSWQLRLSERTPFLLDLWTIAAADRSTPSEKGVPRTGKTPPSTPDRAWWVVTYALHG
jgi:hypothetical protein